MPRGRPPRQPSGRNLKLYHELVYEGRLQADVAARFRVSQPRVAQIVRQINDWIDSFLPATADSLSLAPGMNVAGQRLHLAIALRRQQLIEAYDNYLAHFGGPQGASAYRHLLAAQDAGLVPTEWTRALPPRPLILSALRMARELEDLAALAHRGPFKSRPPTPSGPEAPNNAPFASARTADNASKT